VKIKTTNALAVAAALAGIGYCKLTAAASVTRPGAGQWGLASLSSLDPLSGIQADPTGYSVTIDPGAIYPCRREKQRTAAPMPITDLAA
jgi:hypothetical protein